MWESTPGAECKSPGRVGKATRSTGAFLVVTPAYPVGGSAELMVAAALGPDISALIMVLSVHREKEGRAVAHAVTGRDCSPFVPVE